MFYIKCFSLAPYSVEQMFNLINDVNSYTEFIPGCHTIHILKQNNTELMAEVHVFIGGIIKSLLTHNFYIKNKSILIFLINSPFKSFYGCWNFIPMTKAVCNIEYISYYEFRSDFMGNFLNYSFQRIYKNIIKIFISRAKEIYGTV